MFFDTWAQNIPASALDLRRNKNNPIRDFVFVYRFFIVKIRRPIELIDKVKIDSKSNDEARIIDESETG